MIEQQKKTVMMIRMVLTFDRLSMEKIVWALLALSSFAYFSPAYTAPVATINAFTPPVWVKQNKLKTELTNDSLIERGDHIFTGDIGRVEMNLEADILLHVLANTEIRILRGDNTTSTLATNQTDLYVLTGRACIALSSSFKAYNDIKVNVGNSLFVVAEYISEFCVQRTDGLSSIELKAGNAQVKHITSGDLIVLGEVGTEFRVRDDGSYDWGIPGDGGTLTSENKAAVESEKQPQSQTLEESTQIQSEISSTPTEESTITEIVTKDSSTDKDSLSTASYTVYLFSTRSEDVAKEANSKFLAAGYSTQIKVHESGDEVRYRLMVPGFKTHQSAKEFSSTIVGKLGVTETWIGKSP